MRKDACRNARALQANAQFDGEGRENRRKRDRAGTSAMRVLALCAGELRLVLFSRDTIEIDLLHENV
jgi:hypothetical protein